MFAIRKPKVDSALLKEFDHLDLAFDYKECSNSSSNVTIDLYWFLLVFTNLYWSLMIGDVFRGQSSNLVAQKSAFGWTLSGCTRGSNSAGISLLRVGIISEQVAKSFWDLESLGIKDNDESVDPILDKFNRSIEHSAESGHYKVLPWFKHILFITRHDKRIGQSKKLLSCLALSMPPWWGRWWETSCTFCERRNSQKYREELSEKG